MYNKDLITKIIPSLSFKFPYDIDDYSEHMYFENYHKHTDSSNYGLADSGECYPAYIKRIKELNSKCLFSGEHGWQGDHIAVYDFAQSEQLKYRHSAEVYWVKDRFEKDKSNCHMVIVAKTVKGRRRLNYLISMANIDGYYMKPRIDLSLLLEEDPNDFIVTSACVAGWEYPDADDIWLKVYKHFGKNFFFELQYHNTDKQKELNAHILDLSRKHGIDIICGLDSHYVSDDGMIKRKMMLLYKYKDENYYSDEVGWYMDFPDVNTIISRFKEQGVLSDEEIYRAIMNTNIFVDDCEEIVLDKKFKIPNIYPELSYEERVKKYHSLLNEAYKKEPVKSKERVAGIKMEAKEVTSSGVVDYFLFNHALIDLAVKKYNGKITTTSRGSMGSFYTNKLLGYTTLDRFNSDVPMYPERFITAERVLAGQMPDCDFNIAEQQPFVNAAKELLGEHGCYPLMAIEKLKVKSAWKLYSKANGVSPSDSDAVSKCIDAYLLDLKHTSEEDRDSINVEDYISEEYADLYRKSVDYQKITINLKCHPCGHLVFSGNILEEIGLVSAISENTNKRTICACVQGGYLDAYGYVKDDFLIVDAVSLTNEFFESIGQPVPTFEELKTMVKGDNLTWDIYEKGITCCVNQLEKESTSNKMKKYKAKNITELSSFIAAIRPSFAPLLNTFLNRQEYSIGEEGLDNLLEDTAHFILYQESIMKILSYLSVSMSETYGVIKAISKKKLKGEKKAHLEEQLRKGWLEQFGNLDRFNEVWQVIEASASYGFNSAHAYSMAGDSLYQAWFKAHHTAKFYEVAMNHYYRKDSKDKIMALSVEAVECFGYKKLPFKFRQDNRGFVVNGEDKTISMCLSSIKGMPKDAANILYALKDKEYKSFLDFLKQENLPKNIIEPLITLDYFSEFGKTKYLKDIYELYQTRYDKDKFKKIIKKDKNIYIDAFVRKYAKETEKQYTITDEEGFMNELISKIPNEHLPLEQLLQAQYEMTGVIQNVNPKLKGIYFICDINTKYSPVVSCIDLGTGETKRFKMKKRDYEMSTIAPFKLMLCQTNPQPRKRKTETGWEETGEMDEWITKFKIRG
jgi:DNA polymerase III alpha subunit